MYRLISDRRKAVKEWREKNPDKVKKQKERYRRKYRHVLADRLRKWKRDNPDRVKIYRKRQREGYYD